MGRLFAVLFFAAAVYCQTVTGSLEGHVVDATGAAMGGVKVSATAADTGLRRETVTNDGGLVAVGTNLTTRPPHRSVRAGLPHTAPTANK